MELDELKYQLNNRLAPDHASKSSEDIASLLKKRTGSVISKLKRSLLAEIVFCAVFVIIMAYIGIMSAYAALRIYFSVFTILAIGFLILLIYLFRRTSLLSGNIMPVRHNLQTISNILDEFVKRYFQFTMALIPVCFIFSLLLSYQQPIRSSQVETLANRFFSATWQLYTFLGVYIITLTVVIYYFTKWYLKKLYGNYLKELKECIAELKAEG